MNKQNIKDIKTLLTNKNMIIGPLIVLVLIVLSVAYFNTENKTPIGTGIFLDSNMVEPQFIAYSNTNSVGTWSFTPDDSYEIVNSIWISSFYEKWRSDLHDRGVIKWDETFDCNKFASHFCSSAQIEYYIETFHSWKKGQALAVAEVWYNSNNRGPHAIVALITERGVVFLEPQNGKELSLTPTELSSISFKRF